MIWPSVGRYMPVSSLIKVDLPAPYTVLFGARRGATIGRPPGPPPLGALALSVVLRGLRP